MLKALSALVCNLMFSLRGRPDYCGFPTHEQHPAVAGPWCDQHLAAWATHWDRLPLSEGPAAEMAGGQAVCARKCRLFSV
eukprot:9767442-Alexandrium_andersonii.AAC.1